MRRYAPRAVALLALAQSGCSGAVEPRPAPELRAAPQSIVADGKNLLLDPHLWRDFAPVSPPDGQPLIAVLRVTAADASPVPSSIRVDAAWVVLGDEVWATSVGEEKFATPSETFYEVVARNGPKWGPGVAVDVIVRVRDSRHAPVLLRAADQLIRRTD